MSENIVKQISYNQPYQAVGTTEYDFSFYLTDWEYCKLANVTHGRTDPHYVLASFLQSMIHSII